MENEQKHRITTDEMQKAAEEFKQIKYKYDAFISYRHVEPDQSIAKQVHQIIETFKAPKEFYINGEKTNFRRYSDDGIGSQEWKIPQKGDKLQIIPAGYYSEALDAAD